MRNTILKIFFLDSRTKKSYLRNHKLTLKFLIILVRHLSSPLTMMIFGKRRRYVRPRPLNQYSSFQNLSSRERLFGKKIIGQAFGFSAGRNFGLIRTQNRSVGGHIFSSSFFLHNSANRLIVLFCKKGVCYRLEII